MRHNDEKCLFAERLRQARLMMHLSMEDLSVRMGRIVTKQSISRYETGRMQPSHSILTALSKVFGVSEGYFYGESVKIDSPRFRLCSYVENNSEEYTRIESLICYWVERYMNMEKSVQLEHEFHNPIANFKVANAHDAEKAALLLRSEWEIGMGPIPSVFRLLERKGIKILETELPESILGLSTWADERQPLMVITNNKHIVTTERLRFTAAHELGHLLMAISPETDSERICNQFAGCFLMPRETLVEEFGEKRQFLTHEEVVDLHLQYGVSVAALIHQAWDMRIIPREHYEWWFNEVINKNKKEEGWGTYPLKEETGREKRIQSIYKQIKKLPPKWEHRS